MAIVKTELKNCSLEINYIGTRQQIAFQKLSRTMEDVSEAFENLGKAILPTVEQINEMMRNLFARTK